ncbi:MAG: hypothetical protein MRJ65_14165 [Candidatus Brocadiaceae bacterium]|nr:hypothetical protein [Candidatus Brocadiaceae bacterium]
MKINTYTADEIYDTVLPSLHSQGYLPISILINVDNIDIDAVCKHGRGSLRKVYRILGENCWQYVNSEHTRLCLVCDGTESSTVVCENCNKELPELSDEERALYHTRGIDIFIDTCCPSCGSHWTVTQKTNE